MSKWSKERYDTLCNLIKSGTDKEMILADLSITSKQYDLACSRMIKMRLTAGKTPEEILQETGLRVDGGASAVVTTVKKRHEHIDPLPVPAPLPDTLKTITMEDITGINNKLDFIIGELAKLGTGVNN